MNERMNLSCNVLFRYVVKIVIHSIFKNYIPIDDQYVSLVFINS